MLFLFIYGNNVENRLGSLWFVVWYLLTGAAATLFHAAFFSSSDVPLVGASGAISGVLGFYFIWFPKNSVRVLVFRLRPDLDRLRRAKAGQEGRVSFEDWHDVRPRPRPGLTFRGSRPNRFFGF